MIKKAKNNDSIEKCTVKALEAPGATVGLGKRGKFCILIIVEEK